MKEITILEDIELLCRKRKKFSFSNKEKMHLLSLFENEKQEFSNFLTKILQQRFDKHSTCDYFINEGGNEKNNEEKNLFELKVDGYIGIINIYGFPYDFTSEDGKDEEYYYFVNSIRKFILRDDLKYIVLDIRENMGGYYIPMVMAFMEYLNNRTLFAFEEYGTKEKINEWVNMIGGEIKYGEFISKNNKDKKPLAVLISRNTISSGEILASCFLPNKKDSFYDKNNIRLFGEKTGGYLSINESFVFGDIVVNLTLFRHVSRNGKKSKYISPHKITSDPYLEAKKWFKI